MIVDIYLCSFYPGIKQILGTLLPNLTIKQLDMIRLKEGLGDDACGYKCNCLNI